MSCCGSNWGNLSSMPSSQSPIPSPQSRISLLGVPLDPITRREAVQRIKELLQSDAQHSVATPNSEMLVEANRNAAFKTVLNQTSLNLPDSAGLLWAAKRTHQRLPERVTGVDTVIALCRELYETTPVFLLGAAEGVAEKAAQKLQSMNPRLQIAGTFAGSPKEEDAAGIMQRINASNAVLLLVAYGAPAQDVWIAQHLKEMPSVRVAMGIGGTFDFLAGIKKRAPQWLQKSGLEWLWRLLIEPSRLPRIMTATVVFPWKIFLGGRE
jgi:N-acetylglucosaminyldiphosphoundecaprenol N-acetyl-beta-D-mannosaminyltransferase